MLPTLIQNEHEEHSDGTSTSKETTEPLQVPLFKKRIYILSINNVQNFCLFLCALLVIYLRNLLRITG
jgi:hypothetical protein